VSAQRISGQSGGSKRATTESRKSILGATTFDTANDKTTTPSFNHPVNLFNTDKMGGVSVKDVEVHNIAHPRLHTATAH
jgi:predicted Ser/Thr protein kinase